MTSQVAVVYLAGGFRSGWQDVVTRRGLQCRFLDPRDHGLTDSKQYTDWDLRAVKASDIVFAYLEESNPGGFALALEVGYAVALGKVVIFVYDTNDPRTSYLEMLRQAATFCFEDFEQALGYLEEQIATHSGEVQHQ